MLRKAADVAQANAPRDTVSMKPIAVRVCVGTNCCFSGGEALLDMLEGDPDLSPFIALEATRCMDKDCAGGRRSPVVDVGGRRFLNATPEVVMEEIERLAQARIAGVEPSPEALDG